MAKIVALLGDYWHNAEDAKAGLEAAVSRLSDNENVVINYITHDEVANVLEEQPDLFINAKMDELNPTDEQVDTWLTELVDQQLSDYVKGGGSILAWHGGMAAFNPESNYIQMLCGYFDYHPPGLQDVTYIPEEDSETGRFSLQDEQYFVKIEEEKTKIDLWSTGVDGDSIAGWKHTYGKGKVACFTPAHTREGMLNEHVSALLAEKLNWLLAE